MVSVRIQKMSSSFRLLAVVATFLWLLAQSWCFQHCARYRFTPGSGACCLKASGERGPKSERDGQMRCGSLKLARVEASAALPLLPDLVIALEPSLLGDWVSMVPTESTADLDLAVQVRGVPRLDFVFQPEVCLGAALRSLAPPTVA